MIYEYRCALCNEIKIVERSIREDEIVPTCCGMYAQRIYNPPPIKFNGAGFYSTDNPKR